MEVQPVEEHHLEALRALDARDVGRLGEANELDVRQCLTEIGRTRQDRGEIMVSYDDERRDIDVANSLVRGRVETNTGRCLARCARLTEFSWYANSTKAGSRASIDRVGPKSQISVSRRFASTHWPASSAASMASDTAAPLA